MALSEYERRVLSELEASLGDGLPAASDVPLPHRSTGRRIMVVGGSVLSLLVAGGLVMLGVVINTAIGVLIALLGFVVAVGAVWAIARCWRLSGAPARCLRAARGWITTPDSWQRTT